MEEEKKNSKLVLELKALLEEYLGQHHSISLHGFSKKCGVSFSTLRRIHNLKTKEDPAPLTVLGIVSTIKKESNIHQLMSLFDHASAIYKSLFRSYSFFNKCLAYKPDLNEVLSDREYYIVYKLAANISGTTRRNIVDLLGNPAEFKIDELLRKELIYEESGRLHAVQKNFSLPGALGLKHIPELLRFVGSGSSFVDKTMFRSISESISKEVYDEVWRIQVDATKRIVSLINKKDSAGEIPFFYVCVLDTMEAPPTDN
ncbi:MAG: hypothetical protein HQK53_18915 [Oligoflexia bacterium]|nr:hypothetical protein [Oligoflexia bacterium]